MKKIKKFKHIGAFAEKKPIDQYVRFLKSDENTKFWLPQASSSYTNKNVKNDKSRKFCLITARKRGHYSKLGFARSQIRDLVNTGIIAGLRKSSW